MIKHKRIGMIAALLMAAAVIVTGFAYLSPTVLASVAKTSEPAYVSAMDKNSIIDIQIIADERDWANMLENATSEEYIPATVIINGKKIENVGIRPKGNSSLSMVASDETTDRFSFKIEFDHYITGQTWLGLDKLAVNNMQGDASYLKEYLSFDIMNYTGVATPLYAFSDISVNGETWGFYLAVECLEDSYAERVYGMDHGELYKPESMGMRGEGRMNEFIEEMENGAFNADQPDNAQAENQGLQPHDGNMPNIRGEGVPGGNMGFGGGFGGMSQGGIALTYTDDEISSYSAIFDNAVFDTTDSDYKRVIASLEKLSNGEDLENTVDVEAVLRYFAAHTVVVNMDSYVSTMAHNYYLYEDNGQLTILPWDYNLAFGGFQSGSASSVVNFPIDTPVSGISLDDRPLLGKLLEVPEYMELYHSYLQQIVDGYFNSGTFAQTMDNVTALIDSHVKNDPTAFYDYAAYKTAVVELKELALLRAESIEGQLNGTIPSTSEGQSAEANKLIDASGIDLNALGSQGGGGFGGMGGDREQGGFGGMGGMDFDKMQQAMAIIQAAGTNELSEEQLTQLKEIGLTDEQITQFQSMAQGGFGGMGGQRPGNMPGGFGGMGGGPPGNAQQDGGGQTAAQQPSFGGQQSSAVSAGIDANTWLLIGGCLASLLAGLLFVLFYKRRRWA